MLYHYYVGLDLGQARDYTAVAVVEEQLWVADRWSPAHGVHLEPGWTSPADLEPWAAEEVLRHNYHRGRPHDPPLLVRHLERFPLGTPYPELVTRVQRLLESEPLRERRVALEVDKTGVGAPVVDLFRLSGLHPIPIMLHGGDRVIVEPTGGYRVPKRDVVHAAQVALESRRLKIAGRLKHADTLVHELRSFTGKIDERTAHDTYAAWREGDHDDLLLAVSMAVWHRQHRNALIDRANSRRERREAAAGA